jgi:hypothetical protein
LPRASRASALSTVKTLSTSVCCEVPRMHSSVATSVDQWQRTSAREGKWVAGMARELREGVRAEGVGLVLQQRLYGFTSLSS